MDRRRLEEAGVDLASIPLAHCLYR
jgi:hypothetical protein